MSELDTLGPLSIDVEEVSGSVEEVLDALGQTMPMLLGSNPDGPDQTVLEQTEFRGSIAVIGPEPLMITIDANGAMAAKLALGWSLAGAEGPNMADATDALGEFVNIVGGAVKAVLNDESSLGLPTIEALDEAGPSSDPEVITIDHAIGRIDIRVARN
jgi:chemotaxis protein CheX